MLLEIDLHNNWRVVRWRWLSSLDLVDVRARHPFGQRGRNAHVVDAVAHVSAEGTLAVVPPAVQSSLLPAKTEGVDQPTVEQLLKGGALGRVEVDLPLQ